MTLNAKKITGSLGEVSQLHPRAYSRTRIHRSSPELLLGPMVQADFKFVLIGHLFSNG